MSAPQPQAGSSMNSGAANGSSGSSSSSSAAVPAGANKQGGSKKPIKKSRPVGVYDFLGEWDVGIDNI